MKYFVALTIFASAFTTAFAYASSVVKFPVAHEEIKSYPGQVEIILNGARGLHNDVAYTLSCHLSNPTQETILTHFSIDPYSMCKTLTDCGSVKLNDSFTAKMMHLQPGLNTLVFTSFITAYYNPNTKLVFSNYDDSASVFVEDCSAVLE